ncbi:putative F-box protein At1g67623 [Lotus japonicus]|uniref:putative F-box protein At1g67623 n=1 Tax=Lotus japonicus TaxID=34305 RepID=UPI0025900DCB|nr:putative F-box protein At1g67623 [Lotus japonicus]
MTYSILVKWARHKRRSTRKGSHSTSTIKILLRDLLVEVVAKVASHSLIDLQNIKRCCKGFLDASEDSYVWQRVSLDTFLLIQWLPNDEVSSFLKRCRKCGNIESLYREGLREYFDYPNGKIDGLEMLKVAAQKGHKEAKYVCGMILLCSKHKELRKQGLEYMRQLRNSKCVVSSRKKVKQLVGSVWKNNGMLKRNQSPLFNSKSTCKGWKVKTGIWILLDDDDDDNNNGDDISLCEYCRWDHELEFFYQVFNVH